MVLQNESTIKTLLSLIRIHETLLGPDDDIQWKANNIKARLFSKDFTRNSLG